MSLCSTCEAPAPDAYLCANCTGRLTAALRRVPELADELEITITRQTAARTHSAGRAADHPVPFHAAASAAKTALLEALARTVRALQPQPAGVHVYTPHGVSVTHESLSAWLAQRPSWIAGHADAARLTADLHDAINRAWSTVDSYGQRRYCGPCDCGADLYARAGRDWARCQQCGLEWPADALRAWLAEEAEERLLPASAIAELLPALTGTSVTPAAVRGWARHGRLIARDETVKGTSRVIPLYRVGDAVDIVLGRPVAA